MSQHYHKRLLIIKRFNNSIRTVKFINVLCHDKCHTHPIVVNIENSDQELDNSASQDKDGILVELLGEDQLPIERHLLP